MSKHRTLKTEYPTHRYDTGKPENTPGGMSGQERVCEGGPKHTGNKLPEPAEPTSSMSSFRDLLYPQPLRYGKKRMLRFRNPEFRTSPGRKYELRMTGFLNIPHPEMRPLLITIRVRIKE